MAYLGECGFDMFEPSGTGVVAHGEEDKVDGQLAVQLLDEIRAFAEVTCDRSMVEQENWNAQWEKDYPRVEVRDDGGALKCTIRAPFHAPAAEGMDVVVMPQMSFGTGHHATTHLMTSSMLDLPLESQAVLDMGCGTGVLALVAGLPRPKSVLGIDIESHAVDNAEDNLAKNPGISSPVRFECGDGTLLARHPDGAFDMVLANIHKNVLSQDMQVYARVLGRWRSSPVEWVFRGGCSGHAIVRGGGWIARQRGESSRGLGLHGLLETRVIGRLRLGLAQ